MTTTQNTNANTTDNAWGKEIFFITKLVKSSSASLICLIFLRQCIENKDGLENQKFLNIISIVNGLFRKANNALEELLSIHPKMGTVTSTPIREKGQLSKPGNPYSDGFLDWERLKSCVFLSFQTIASAVYTADDKIPYKWKYTIEYFRNRQLRCQYLYHFLVRQTNVHFSRRELLLCVALLSGITDNENLAVVIEAKNNGILRTAKCRLRKKLFAIQSDNKIFLVLKKNISASQWGRKEKPMKKIVTPKECSELFVLLLNALISSDVTIALNDIERAVPLQH